MSTKNIILIGMPASGKSTAGVLLAKTVGYGFIDTDLLIQNEQKSLLCDIIAAKGAEEFIKIEETVLSDLWAERCVVATGGSAVYGERAMRHLKEIGTVVYLKLGEKTIEKRLKNIVLRGVVGRGFIRRARSAVRKICRHHRRLRGEGRRADGARDYRGSRAQIIRRGAAC